MTTSLIGDRNDAAASRRREPGALRMPVLLAIAAVCGAVTTVAIQRWLAPAETAPAMPAEQVLAVVDGQPITTADFADEMAERGAGNFGTVAARRGLLDDMVQTKVLAANGRARGYLGEYGVRRELESIVAGKYQREVIEPQLAALDVNDDEVAAYYADHQRRFVIPEAAHAAIIFFEVRAHTPDDVVAETRARAARVHAEAARQHEPTFGVLAIDNSDDQASRYRGGDVGWLAAGQPDSRWEPAVMEAIFALEQPGDLAPVVETPSGLYVIRLLEKQPESLRPLEEVAPAIHYLLMAEKRAQRSEALYALAAAKVAVEVHADRLPPPEVETQPDLPGAPPPVPNL